MKEERGSRRRGAGWSQSTTKPQKAFHARIQARLTGFFSFLSGSPPETVQVLHGQCRGLLNSPFPRAHSLTDFLFASPSFRGSYSSLEDGGPKLCCSFRAFTHPTPSAHSLETGHVIALCPSAETPDKGCLYSLQHRRGGSKRKTLLNY